MYLGLTYMQIDQSQMTHFVHINKAGIAWEIEIKIKL